MQQNIRQIINQNVNAVRVTSIKHSKKHLKIKRKELDIIESNFKERMCYFVKFMYVFEKQWFNNKEIKQDNQQFFDNSTKVILEKLEMQGKIHYSIVHKEKKTAQNGMSQITRKGFYENFNKVK